MNKTRNKKTKDQFHNPLHYSPTTPRTRPNLFVVLVFGIYIKKKDSVWNHTGNQFISIGYCTEITDHYEECRLLFGGNSDTMLDCRTGRKKQKRNVWKRLDYSKVRKVDEVMKKQNRTQKKKKEKGIRPQERERSWHHQSLQIPFPSSSSYCSAPFQKKKECLNLPVFHKRTKGK